LVSRFGHAGRSTGSDIPAAFFAAAGCDLELDVLPVVACEIPDLPRPLKNWGALRH
jgi:hypothetical protein